MLKAPEQAEISNSPFDAVRRRIAVALVGAMGSVAAPACHISASLNLADKARDAAVNSGKNFKHIMIPEAGATVMLGRQEKGDEKVEGYMYLAPNSPLREARYYTQTFELPQDAAPWETLVMEPSGRITLRMKGNIIAVQFDCSEGGDNCDGDEIDPVELDQVQPAATQQPSEDAGKTAQESNGSTQADEGMEDKTPEAEEPKQTGLPDRIFNEEGQAAYFVPTEIKAALDILESALRTRSPKYLTYVAGKLAKDTKWSEEVEALIAENETMAPDRQELSKENFVIAIKFLLVNNPGAIPQLAQALKIELPKKAEFEREAGAARGSLSDKVYEVPEAIYERREPLRVPITILDLPAKQELARELASVNPEWAAFVEKRISDINTSTAKESDLADTILHLLAFRPSMIDVVAKKLGVVPQEPKSTEAADEKETAELERGIREANRAIETLRNSPVR
jgi:hypothetical protein